MSLSDHQTQLSWLIIIAFFGLYPLFVLLTFGISLKLPGVIVRIFRRVGRRAPRSNVSLNLLYGALLVLSVGLLIWSRIGAPFSWLMPLLAFPLYVFRIARGWD